MTPATNRASQLPSSILVASLAWGLFLGTLPWPGSAGAASNRSAGTSATLQTVADDYRQARLQTAATEEALDELVLAPNPDLPQAFEEFHDNFQRMEQIGKELLRHADGMHYRGTYYFVESPKTLESCPFPRSARYADQQSIDLGENFGLVSETGGGVKLAFRAYQFDIEQLDDYFGNHLTPAGLVTMAQILRKARVDGDNLQLMLSLALKALERAKATLPVSPPVSPLGSAPVSPPGG